MQLTYNDYTVGWIAALPHELAPACALLDEQHEDLEGHSKDSNTYTLGRIGKHNIVITALPIGTIGTNAAASVAKDLLRSFKNVRFGLMVGIGGGVPCGSKDVRLGDVVVSTREGRCGGVVHYDFGVQLQQTDDQDLHSDTFTVRGYLRDPPPALQTAVANLKAKAMVHGYQFPSIYEKMVEDNLRMKQVFRKPPSDIVYRAEYVHQDGYDCSGCDKTQQIQRQEREDDEPLVHLGVIGSGNQVIRNALLRDELHKKEKIICFEMEAAGLMQNFECMVIRGICDYCDSHKNKIWQPYAAAIAASYAKELLLTLPARQVETMPKSKLLESIDNDLKEIKAQNTELIASQQSFALRDAIHWINAPDPRPNFLLAKQRQEPGTGAWFHDSEAYSQWKEGYKRHLWLHGKPGCGKSVIAAATIEEIQQYCTKIDAGFAMFYFTFTDVGKQSWNSCLRSLVIQLTAQEAASSLLIDAHKQSRTEPTPTVLLEILLEAIKSRKQVFIVLDALDESPEEHDGEYTVREMLLTELTALSKIAPNIKYFLTSRNVVDIQQVMADLDVLQIAMVPEFVDRDIGKYISAQLNMDRKLAKLDTATKNQIMTALIRKADGMFRWAYCQLRELRNLKLMRPSDIRRALESLPETLDDTYERILTNIEKSSRSAAISLLQWIAYAKRPLALAELAETVVIRLNQENDYIDLLDRPVPEGVLELLSSMVVIKAEQLERDSAESDEETDSEEDAEHYSTEIAWDIQSLSLKENPNFAKFRITLAHFSIKEYLESERSASSAFHLNPDRDQHFLSDCCLAYLLSYAASTLRVNTLEDLETFPLLAYAARFWYQHHRNVDETKRVRLLLCTPASMESWIRVHLVDRREHGLFAKDQPGVFPLDRNIQALYVASYLGFTAIVKDLISSGADVNAYGGFYGTALPAAAACGHAKIVKMLMNAGANVNASADFSPAALVCAARRGHEHIVKMLLGVKVKFDAKGSLMENALEAAIIERHRNIVTMLIEAGADANASTRTYGHSLIAAASYGDIWAVRTLVEAGSNIYAEDSRFGNVLHIAAQHSDMKFVEILINEFHVDASVIAGPYGDVLQNAVVGGSDTIVNLLIQQCHVNVNVQCGRNGSALAAAIHRQNMSLVKILIAHGAEVDIPDRAGRIAIHYAAQAGNLEILEYLRDNRECNFEALDWAGKSVLDYACISGSVQMVKRILDLLQFENGKDLGFSVWSSLHWACREGSYEVLKLLSDRGLQANVVKTSRPACSWSPLDIAVYHKNKQLISEDGNFLPICDWRSLSPCGLVERPARSGRDNIPVRMNRLTPAKRALPLWPCHGCLLLIRGTFVVGDYTDDRYMDDRYKDDRRMRLCLMCMRIPSARFHICDPQWHENQDNYPFEQRERSPEEERLAWERILKKDQKARNR